MEAERLLREERLPEALAALEEAVRGNPANAKHRVFLFQLLAVLGEWQRALAQLQVAGELDAANLLLAQVYRDAVRSEVLRAEVFAGKRSPLVLGQPPEWMAWMIQAIQMTADGRHGQSDRLRTQALEAAPAVPGSVNGEPFEWIADMDSRLGPILEAIVGGRYYWIPFSHIHQIVLEAPTDLRDLVWAPAEFTWTNGGQAIGLVPARYPGSESSEDAAVRLARKTEWVDGGPEVFLGMGQRMLATDQGEYPLLETRRVVIGEAPEPEPDADHG